MSRAWAIVGALSLTETVSWGVLYYAFAVFLAPMRQELGFSAAQLTGAFSVVLLISGVAGIAVGRYLDRHSPRPLMTAGSVAGAALVLAWSQVHGLAALYAIWVGIGLAMAAVLYEPAFTVLAKEFPETDERRRAMTALTLVAALASFIFLPLAQGLIDALGWRDALIVLAVLLGVLTVPPHALVLRPEPPSRDVAAQSARAALRSAPFWLLAMAFFLASLTTFTMAVHAIPYLLDRGFSSGFAAFSVGLVGISQIPGRLLFAPLAARLPSAAVFVPIAAGVAVIVAMHATAAVVAGLVLLGMGNGMSTLARATAFADLYGPDAYGTIAGTAAAMTTVARAAGPVAGALYAGLVGYDALLWTLAALALAAAPLAYRSATAATAPASSIRTP